MKQQFTDKFGIIDIGSNTIRGVLYDENGDIADNCAHESHILADTKKSILSKDGLLRLCKSLTELSCGFSENGAKSIFAFATSAMRDVKNFDEVFESVLSKTGIKIDLLSGEQEAECDYRALLSVSGSGTGVDLGGGSGQIIVFGEDGVYESCSVPIGVKRVRNMFCRTIVPEKGEIEQIDRYVKKELSAIKSRNNELIFMGGTAKAALSAADKLFKSTVLDKELLKAMFDVTAKNPTLLKRVFEKRYETMPTGLIVVKSICDSLGADKIKVTERGVREGYIDMICERL